MASQLVPQTYQSETEREAAILEAQDAALALAVQLNNDPYGLDLPKPAPKESVRSLVRAVLDDLIRIAADSNATGAIAQRAETAAEQLARALELDAARTAIVKQGYALTLDDDVAVAEIVHQLDETPEDVAVRLLTLERMVSSAAEKEALGFRRPMGVR